MLYFYSTRKKNINYTRQVIKSSKNKIKVHEFINDNRYSLTQCYNIALSLCEEDEILILAHDDIVLPYGWDQKIINIFETTDYGIIGAAGTTMLNKSGVWWENRENLAGIVSHQKIIDKKLYKYDTKFSEDHSFVMNVCCIDGVFMAIKKNRIKCKFNEEITGFHFYDISFSVDNFVRGVKIGVTTAFKIHHRSIGETTSNWHVNQNIFSSKYNDMLPIKCDPNLNEMAPNREVKINPIEVGVIILTKDKIDYLTKCLESLIEKTNPNIVLKIVIGDTGSTEESLTQLQTYIETKSTSIVVHKLDYYNFAKNNNELCKKYFSDIELLLFCNNDIELINNALDLMVNTYQTNKSNCGTIGCRLLYPNLRVQHGGIVIYADKNNIRGATHFGLKSYYSAKSSMTNAIVGCTGAFLLINTQLFLSLEGFNEKTVECFEDVILNIETRAVKNRVNYYQGNAVCYHHESITRNEDPMQLQRVQQDFVYTLIPSIIKHKEKLKKFILVI